ncbi:hypothetical protein ADIMK_0025 [Marinobacterium lacunae]|uniref:Uncharacterized protein n=1 Tax=Marinobacterium lacunae TaxID=1232683 RepID=A0A081G4K8_9GAMM|nr:hypothetical protein ADIMK_0025 [Marinobacterium lacunae]
MKRLVLTAAEGSLYTAEVSTDDGRYSICDAHGAILCFRSQLDAKRLFKGMGISDTRLVHHSAYGEMIGLSEDRVEPLEVQLLNPDQDLS